MDGKGNKGILHRLILEKDKSLISSIVKETPSLNPILIIAVMKCYERFRKNPQGKSITPLIAAIYMGEENICKHLIEEGADVNWGYLDNMGPLCLSLHHKHHKIADLLIKSGANVHIFDRQGKSPLYHAIENDSLSIVKIIISAGFPKDGDIYDNGLVKLDSLMTAIKVNNVSIVKFLLEQNVNVNSYKPHGITPLICAIIERSIEILKLLIDHGADVEGLFKNDAPPLFIAVQLEDTSILKVLLEAGVNVNRVFTPFGYSFNTLPLPFATALQIAICTSNLQATKLLLTRGVNVNAIDLIHNISPLHVAFSMNSVLLKENHKSNHRKIIKCLLENIADINVKDFEGKLPVHLIFYSKNWIALEEYILFGGDLNQPLSPRDGSILRLVICHKVHDLVELCLAHGANCFQKFEGNPVYNDVIKSDCPEILRLFWKYSYPFHDLPPFGSLKSSSKVLKLLKAQFLFKQSITDNKIVSVKSALMRGAEVNCQFEDSSDYPLHICSAVGNKELVEILLDKGATISTVNRAGYSALHVAAKAGHLEICKLLLSHGASLDYRGPKGFTPFDLAQKEGHTEVVDFLKSVSVLFSKLKRKHEKVIGLLKLKIASAELSIFINCVNQYGNTLLGEALRLNLKDVAMKLMTLRLEAGRS